MKKVKLKERFDNAAQAFFDHEKPEDSFLTTYETSSAVEKAPYFSKTTRSVFNVLRQLFLFLPGTFVLYPTTIALTAIVISGDARYELSFFLVLLLNVFASAFLTVLGLGDVRKPKYFAIPLSIIAIGILFGILCFWLFDSGIGLRIFLEKFAPYYFPLAFIVPVLVKGWLDKTEG